MEPKLSWENRMSVCRCRRWERRDLATSRLQGSSVAHPSLSRYFFFSPIWKRAFLTCSYYPQRGLLLVIWLLVHWKMCADRIKFHLVHDRCVFAPSASVVWSCSASFIWKWWPFKYHLVAAGLNNSHRRTDVFRYPGYNMFASVCFLKLRPSCWLCKAQKMLAHPSGTLISHRLIG